MDIWLWIARESPAQASRFIKQISEKFKPLCTHPNMGPKRDELSPGLRVQFYQNYAIYYTSTNTDLIILHVTHLSRDQAASFDNE